MREAIRGAKRTLTSPKALAVVGLREGAGALLGPFSFGVNSVEDLVREGPATGRVLAATLLARDPDWRSLSAIEVAIGDKNDFVRAAAAQALAERGQRSAVATIAPLLDDKNPLVSYTAAAAVIRLESRAARPAKPQSPSQTQAAK
jgi:hypothetical protein